MPEHQVSVGLGLNVPVIVSRFADTVGDGSGTDNFIGDYSSTAEEAIFAAGPRQSIMLARLIVSIEDGAGFKAGNYADLASALTNGIEIKHIDADGTTVINDLTDGVPVKSNGAWGALMYDVDVKAWGNGNDFLMARWTFEKSGTAGVHLNQSESLRIMLNDDFSTVVSHRFMCQGFDRNSTH